MIACIHRLYFPLLVDMLEKAGQGLSRRDFIKGVGAMGGVLAFGDKVSSGVCRKQDNGQKRRGGCHLLRRSYRYNDSERASCRDIGRSERQYSGGRFPEGSHGEKASGSN